MTAARSDPSDPGPRPGRSWRWLALLVVPGAIVLGGIMTSRWMGPFWVWRTDPDYCYLLNGLNLLQGAAPFHADHPGTPVQLLVAGAIALAHTIAGKDPSIRADVLARPEFYLTASLSAMLALLAACAFLFGLAAFRVSRSVWCAIAGQLGCIATLAAVRTFARVNPEPALVCIAMLLGAVALLVTAHDGTRMRSPRWTMLLGALVGVGIAVKVTFFPLGLIALAAVRGIRQWLILAAAAIVSLAISISPIWSRWTYVRDWIWSNIQGTGRYGGGQKTYIDRARYLTDLKTQLGFEPAFIALAGICVLAVIAATIAAQFGAASDRTRRLRTLLAAVVGAQVLLFLLVAKAPPTVGFFHSSRYLVPALATMGTAVCILWLLAQSLPRWPARGFTVLLAAGVIGISAWTTARVLEFRTQVNWKHARSLRIIETAEQYPGKLIAYGYGSTNPIYALLFADHYAGNRYSAALAERFPHAVHYSIWERKFSRAAQPVPDKQILQWAADGELLMQLRPPQLPKHLKFTPIIPWGDENLFHVAPPDRR